MLVRSLILKLSHHESVTALVSGNGAHVCYVIGPGSFYLSSISDLNDRITFVSCDGLWVRRKSDEIDEATIQATTLMAIMEHEQHVIKAIKAHFGCAKIGLLGFSAPAALAFQYALEHPEDIACVVGTGSALCSLDPSFSATDKAFKENASPQKIQRFEKDLKNYQQLQEDKKEAEALPSSNFVWDATKRRRRLTPNSDYLEQIRFLMAKMVFDERYQQDCFNHWIHNPIDQVVCQPMREHFFNNIQPTLDTLELLSALEKQGKVPVLLEHGKNDFITPADEKIVTVFASYTHVKLKLHKECGHLVYIEKLADYTQEVLEFIRQYTPMKSINHNRECKQKFLENSIHKKETTKVTGLSSSDDNNAPLILKSKL